MDTGDIVLSFSQLASWLTVAAAGLMAMQALGINPQPLLAVGGFGSVILGLASQQVLTNMLSGFSLVSAAAAAAAGQLLAGQPDCN